MLAEALEALAELGHELVEPLRFDGVLDLVVEPAAVEPALDDGHRERAAASTDHGLERLCLALGDHLAGQDLASGILLPEPLGELLGQLTEVDVAVGMSQDQEIIGPDAVRW